MRADSLQVDDLIRKLKDAKMDLTAADSDPKARPRSSRRREKVGTASTTDNTGTQTLEIHKGERQQLITRRARAVAGIYKVAGEIWR